jgi:hypothetical protein
MEEAVRTAEAPARASEASGSDAAAAATGVLAASVDPSKKRKRGFSSLR